MRFAFADPPYFGCAERLYGPQAHVYDTLQGHFDLFVRLRDEYPAGWALSCRSENLWDFAPLVTEVFSCRPRIGAWVKPFGSFKANVNPAYVWEPVLFMGGRRYSREDPTVRDWLAANITLRKGLLGAKPPRFCDWVFDLLGATDEDELDDLFPGTGVVTARWKARQGKLALA